jgi:HK97 family phage major capsid protein/HK97 family phage prohead protease
MKPIAWRDGESPANSLTRELVFEIRAETADEETRTVEMSFSSDVPYERWWGMEILDHQKKSVRLGRLNGSASVLVNHDTRDQVGVVEKAWLDGAHGRAVVRFSKSARGDEIYQDVRDGIRKLVSVGYRVHKVVLESQEGETNTYRVTDWEPYEVSIVSVPADTSVGIGRDGQPTGFDPRTLITEEEDDMINQTRDSGAGGPAPSVAAPAAPVVTEVRAAAPAAPAGPSSDEIRAQERSRIAEITAMGTRLNCRELADAAIADGRGLDAFIRDYNARTPATQAVRTAESPAIGLTQREVQQFSFLRMFNALSNPDSASLRESAAFEFECSRAAIAAGVGLQRGAQHRIPFDVLVGMGGQRDLNVGTATAGGHLVETELRAESFIELLRNAMALEQVGITMIPDLNGNIAIPRQTGGATAYWVAEGAAATESQQAFDQVALTPKTVAAFVDLTRQFMMQSAVAAETMVRNDLAQIIALALDSAGINGTGASNQPRGIRTTAGIGSVAGGTNGLAPALSHIVDLETAVANSNAARGNLAYLTNTKVRGKLKLTQKFASTNGDPIWERGNEMNGYMAAVSNQVPSNLVKGSSGAVCSSIIFGNFADLIVGMWGGLDVLVNPYINSGTGTVRIEVFQSVDVAVRQPASFAVMDDALTV